MTHGEAYNLIVGRYAQEFLDSMGTDREPDAHALFAKVARELSTDDDEISVEEAA